VETNQHRLVRLVISAISEFKKVKYFHGLINLGVEEGDEKWLLFHFDCYEKLSKPHFKKLEEILDDLWEAISCNEDTADRGQ
jgi:hypothetical protein